jgi:hypothetical protein
MNYNGIKRLLTTLLWAASFAAFTTATYAQTASELDAGAIGNDPVEIAPYYDTPVQPNDVNVPPRRTIESMPLYVPPQADVPAEPAAVEPAPQPSGPQTPAVQPPTEPAPISITPPIPQSSAPAPVLAAPIAVGEPKIAILLPTKTPAYNGAAQIVLQGFSAAARAQGKAEQCIFIEHAVGEIVPAYNEAVRAGATVIVGPLVRDDLRDLAYGDPQTWTITLTQLDDDNVPLPRHILPLTLAVESDARLLAREIALTSTGVGLPAILSSESPLMRRFSDAFIDEWMRLGKEPISRTLFNEKQLAAVKITLTEMAPSVVVLAVDGDYAADARAQTRTWVTYASGHIYRRPLKFEGHLLDKVRVVEIPWLIQPNAPEFNPLGQQPTQPASARLYALGFDAFAVAQAFIVGNPETLDFWGPSGNVHYSPESGLSRFGQIGIFDEGRLRPIGAR